MGIKITVYIGGYFVWVKSCRVVELSLGDWGKFVYIPELKR